MNGTVIRFERVTFSRKISVRDGVSPYKVVLRDLSLKVDRGEKIGLIGSNGAGKTTLLRLAAGIFVPDVGEVSRVGGVSTLFDSDFGFDFRLSGRENCRSRAILANLKGEYRRRFETEVEMFADLGDAFDQHLSTYSTGMSARLAFALCVSEYSETLLIDEGIGAVDSEFRRKALNRLRKAISSAGTLIMASHDSEFLKAHCDRGLVLSNGRVTVDAPIEEALSAYETMSQSHQHDS